VSHTTDPNRTSSVVNTRLSVRDALFPINGRIAGSGATCTVASGQDVRSSSCPDICCGQRHRQCSLHSVRLHRNNGIHRVSGLPAAIRIKLTVAWDSVPSSHSRVTATRHWSAVFRHRSVGVRTGSDCGNRQAGVTHRSIVRETFDATDRLSVAAKAAYRQNLPQSFVLALTKHSIDKRRKP
jgi:hypothetical protein